MQKINAVRLTFFVKRTAFIFYGDDESISERVKV